LLTLPITQLQMILGMIIAEVWLLSDPKYTVKIGSDNYFSLAVGGVLALFFVFLYLAIKFSHRLQFREERVQLGQGTTRQIIRDSNSNSLNSDFRSKKIQMK